MPTTLTYLFLILTYLQVTTYAKNKVTNITKVVWIVFGMVIITLRITADYFDDLGLNQHDVYRIWAIGTFLIMLLIQITLILYPESLLITENQILRAHNLYRFANRNRNEGSGHHLSFKYQDRVVSYLDSLPPELLKSID